jgi:GDPmannose 4,6-dehydratase
MTETAIIVGERGQDGTLLKASLRNQGFKVIGISRDYLCLPDKKTSDYNFSILNSDQVESLISEFKPSEIYYLAAHHFSSEHIEGVISQADYSAYHDVNVIGLLNFLTAIVKKSPTSRLFYAASSLVFSGINGSVQNEDTPFTPVGFYGLTKTQGILLCRDFRQRHSLFVAAGILYNHESVHRSEKFFSKKIITAAHRISEGLQKELLVGSLESQTDWGYAADYIDAFQRMLRIDKSADFVVATGVSHSAAEFIKIVFDCFQLNYFEFVRENNLLLTRNQPLKIGDSSRLKAATEWSPSIDFNGMVRKLVSDYLTRSNFK